MVISTPKSICSLSSHLTSGLGGPARAVPVFNIWLALPNEYV